MRGLLESAEPPAELEALTEERFERALRTQHRGYSNPADWALPEVEHFTGIVEEYRYNEETGNIDYTRTQDVSAILDDNAEKRNGNFEGWRKKEDKWVQMASIPNIIVEMWMKEGIDVYKAKCDRNGVPNDHMRAVLKKLRDPDWKYLKTHDMDFGTGKGAGNTRLATIPGNGLIWPGSNW